MLDPRIRVTVVSGHFGPRERIAEEPIDRNVWGLLKDFGDAELARMIVPRALYLEHGPVATNRPPAARPGRSGAAPGRVPSPTLAAFQAEVERIGAHPSMQDAIRPNLMVATTADGAALPGLPGTMARLGKDLGLDADRDFAPPRPAALADIDARQKRPG